MIAVVCAFIVLLATVARLGLMAKLHTMPSGYHPIYHAVSDYGVGPTAKVARLLAGPTVIGWWAFAASAYAAFPPGAHRTWAIACCCVAGLSVVAIQWLPTDLEGEKLTFRGLAHYILAIVQFACAYSPMSNIAEVLNSSVLSGVRVATLISLISVCVTIAGPGRRVFGLFERLFLLSVLCFYAAAAVLIINQYLTLYGSS